jgi:hypothetical protein
MRKKPQPVEQNHLKNHRRTTERKKDSPADVASWDLKNDAPRKKTLRAKARAAPAESFQEFWSVYPRRVAKESARRAFERALNAGAAPETLIAGAKRYAIERAGQEPRYTKHPATWLNAGCWEDEAPGAPVIDEHGNVVAIEQAQQQAPPRARGFASIAEELIAQGGEDWR